MKFSNFDSPALAQAGAWAKKQLTLPQQMSEPNESKPSVKSGSKKRKKSPKKK